MLTNVKLHKAGHREAKAPQTHGPVSLVILGGGARPLNGPGSLL